MTLRVEIFFAPGCKNCGDARDALRKLVDEIGHDRIRAREVNITEEPDYAVQLGVLATPAIAINGELVFASLPSEKKLRAALQARLREDR